MNISCFLFCCGFLLLSGSIPTTKAAVKSLSITQKLDNFDANNKNTLKLRYLANADFFKAGGPMFIMVGGQEQINEAMLQTSQFADMAKEHKAYLFYTEHRFYSTDQSTDLSLENLQFLTAKQALADIANFISTMKSTIPDLKNSKVILAGGSYSASLVTWFKKVYPDMISGAWASSAPLLAKLDFSENKKAVGDSIRKIAGDNCYNSIKKANDELLNLISQKKDKELKELLNLCDTFDINNEKDVQTLFSETSDLVASQVTTYDGANVNEACEFIVNDPNTVAAYASYLVSLYPENKCIDLSYATALKKMKKTDEKFDIVRQNLYQRCNEFGWFQTSKSTGQPFGNKFPLQYYTGLCADVFGSKFTTSYITSQISETNKMFGGLNPNVANVFFTQGDLDPWSLLGIRDNSRGAVVPMYAQSMDFISKSKFDTPEMADAKLRLEAAVRKWLK